MKISKSIQCVLALVATISAIPVFAQTPPTLNCQLYAGVTITGATGSLYAIQANSDLSNSNGWYNVGEVALSGTNLLWVDTSRPASLGQQFYRAVQASSNLVYIAPGTFTMGSPTTEAVRGTDEVQHTVTLSRGFYMDKFQVTQGEYLATVGSNPSFHTGNDQYPVEGTSWGDATNYCALRTAQEQAAGLIPANWAYRLPTESEWEYAARAGTTNAFYLGDSLRSQQANFNGTNEYDSVVGDEYNPNGVRLGMTSVVGSYAPNPWGLYDMAGNLMEWCQDWYGAYPTGNVTDPQGPPTAAGRSARGGSYGSPGHSCRSAARNKPIPGNRTGVIGFRVVLASQ